MKTLNLDDAAETLLIHPSTLSEMARKGEIPAAKLGRSWIFEESILHDWLRRETDAQTQKRALGPHTVPGSNAPILTAPRGTQQ